MRWRIVLVLAVSLPSSAAFVAAPSRRQVERNLFIGIGETNEPQQWSSSFRTMLQAGKDPVNEEVAEEEGFLRGITKKLWRVGSLEQRQSVVNNNGATDQRNVALQEPNLVAGVFATVDELRKRTNSMRSIEVLEEMVQSGGLMTPQEEERRLNELRNQIAVNRNKQERLEKALKGLVKEETESRDKSRKEALSIAKQRIEEKVVGVKQQGMLYERQRKLVLVVSGKAPKESLVDKSGTTPIFMQLFQQKGDESTTDDNTKQGPTNLVAGAFETVDELRKRTISMRSIEVLEDMVQAGSLLSPQKEKRRSSEIRDQFSLNRNKQERLEKALKELTKEESKSRDKSRKEALSIAKERIEEKIVRCKQQGALYERQRKLMLVASGKAPKESLLSTGGTPSLMQFIRKGGKSAQQGASRRGKNIQSVPQTLFARNTNETDTIASDGSAVGSGGLAQRFMSNMWDSTFGQKDVGQKEEWVVAFRKSSIDPGEVKPVNVAGLDLLVVATRDGKKIYCIANSCSHLGTPLETGRVERRETDRPTEDGCEDCIVCPLHMTAFALESGEVKGEWCPYPPVLGKMMGAVKSQSSLAVFDIRTRGKNIEILLSSSLEDDDKEGA